MAAAYDEERLLTDIENLFKNNFATKIAAINSEKSDSITLVTVDSTNGYFADMNDKSANYNPIILTAITDQTSESNGAATLRTITVNVALILSDDIGDANILKRMLRYGRAMREIVEDKFFNLRSVDIFKIESLPVLSFQKSGQSEVYKVVGINIITSIC